MLVFERIKALYDSGKIKSLEIYVRKGIITPEQANEIMGIHWY